MSNTDSSIGFNPRIVSVLAYLFLWVGGLAVLAFEHRNKFIRFHALQSIFFNAAASAIFLLVGIGVGVAGTLPVVGPSIVEFADRLVNFYYLLILASWLLAMYPAFRGYHWKMPVIGHIAERYA